MSHRAPRLLISRVFAGESLEESHGALEHFGGVDECVEVSRELADLVVRLAQGQPRFPILVSLQEPLELAVELPRSAEQLAAGAP